jgi:hypothetical protein
MQSTCEIQSVCALAEPGDALGRWGREVAASSHEATTAGDDSSGGTRVTPKCILPVRWRQIGINHQSAKASLYDSNYVLWRCVITFVNLVCRNMLAVIPLQHLEERLVASELPRLIHMQL